MTNCKPTAPSDTLFKTCLRWLSIKKSRSEMKHHLASTNATCPDATNIHLCEQKPHGLPCQLFVPAGVPLRNLDRRWNVAFCFHSQELTYKTHDLIVHNDCTNSCIQYSMATPESIPYGQPIEIHYPLFSGTLQYYVHNSPPMPSAQAHLPSPSSSSRDFHPTPLPFVPCTVPSLLGPIQSPHCANPPSCLCPRVKRDDIRAFPSHLTA